MTTTRHASSDAATSATASSTVSCCVDVWRLDVVVLHDIGSTAAKVGEGRPEGADQ